MNRTLAILGATGAVGSTLAGHVLRGHLLEPGDELILVGHGEPESDARLLAMRIDLLDAFDESRIRISVSADLDCFEADIVVVASGVTISADHPTRRDLAMCNLDLFRHIASTCVARLPNALFIVVSNPVELAVEIFSAATSACHVLGMGAQQDSFRFARAIAEDLGLCRHEVFASVLGEHGQAMLPIWSSVQLFTNEVSVQQRLVVMRDRFRLEDLAQRVDRLRQHATALLASHRVPEAYQATLEEGPDARIFIEPFLTAHLLHSTPNATTNATIYCIAAALTNDGRPVHGQVLADGHFGDLNGVCGVPVTLSRVGWKAAQEAVLTDKERLRLTQCSLAIQQANSLAHNPVGSDLAVPAVPSGT
jgi:malate dehydrogenase